MIDYETSFANTDLVAFPNTGAVNASGAGTTDGTEFVKIFIDDIWGARQALMDYAGLTPDTVSEAAGASQALDALLLIAGGPGEAVQYMKNADPSVNGDRVLLLNGQGITRSSYLELDANVYIGDTLNPTASAFYHADNADGSSRNTAGVYLILPETRGYAPRGLDIAASVDPDGASRDLGSLQIDAGQGRWHEIYTGDSGTADIQGSIIRTRDVNVDPNLRQPGVQIGVQSPYSDGTNGTPRTSSETRMSNFATSFGIRY